MNALQLSLLCSQQQNIENVALGDTQLLISLSSLKSKNHIHADSAYFNALTIQSYLTGQAALEITR